MGEFTGKGVVVTGGGSGLGRACAIAFAAEGARILIAGRRADRLDGTASLAAPGQVETLVADLTREDDRQQVARAASERIDGCDILVNNAGILVAGSVETTDLAAWDRTMDVNLRSVFALTRLMLPDLVRRRGCIVNISSVAGLRPYPGVLAYCVSKAALDQMTRCLALELAPHGVRVNAVNPGVVETDLHRAGGMSETDYAAFLERSVTTHPLGRAGRPEEVAALVLFLASTRSGWITGTTSSIDGGRAIASAR